MDLQECPVLVKPECVKVRYPKVKTEYESQYYYYQKPIDHSLINMDAVCVADSVSSENNEIVINEILSRLEEFKCNDVRQREAVKVGFDIYQKGDKVTEFEWDSKSYNNLIVAIFQRHLSSRTTPCPMAVERLAPVANRIFRRILSNLPEIDIVGPEEWVNNKDWTLPKKQKYLRVIHKQLHYPALENFKGAFTLMVKSGEVNQTCGDVLTHSSRPRLIFNPSDNYCGLLTYVQDQLFKDIKHSIPSFCHGDNADSLKYRIKSILGENPAQYKSVSMDGSAFDSTQHYSIIEVVDNQFFSMFTRRITDIVQSILF